MQGVLFGLFRDVGTAEKAHAELLAMGVDESSVLLHRQDVPIAGGHEEREGTHAAPTKPADRGLIAGLVGSFVDSGNERDDASTASTREALHRGNYTVSVRTKDEAEMARAERIFTAHGAVLQLHPDA